MKIARKDFYSGIVLLSLLTATASAATTIYFQQVVDINTRPLPLRANCASFNPTIVGGQSGNVTLSCGGSPAIVATSLCGSGCSATAYIVGFTPTNFPNWILSLSGNPLNCPNSGQNIANGNSTLEGVATPTVPFLSGNSCNYNFQWTQAIPVSSDGSPIGITFTVQWGL